MCGSRLVVLISLLLGNWFTLSGSYSLQNTSGIMIHFGSGSSIDQSATVKVRGLLTLGANGAAYLTMNPQAKLDVGKHANVEVKRGNISLLSGASAIFGDEYFYSNIRIDGQLILEENATFAESIEISAVQDSRIIFGPNAHYSREEISEDIGIEMVNSTLAIGADVSLIMSTGTFILKNSAFHIGEMCKLHLSNRLDFDSSSFTMGSGASLTLPLGIGLSLRQVMWTMGNGANLTVNSFQALNIFGNVDMGDNSTLVINAAELGHLPLALLPEGSITIGANSTLIVDHDCEIAAPVVVPTHRTAEICEFVTTCSGCSSASASSSIFTAHDTICNAFKMVLGVCMSILYHRMSLKF